MHLVTRKSNQNIASYAYRYIDSVASKDVEEEELQPKPDSAAAAATFFFLYQEQEQQQHPAGCMDGLLDGQLEDMMGDELHVSMDNWRKGWMISYMDGWIIEGKDG